MKNRKISLLNASFSTLTTTSTPSKTLLWGATGEQDWTPQLTTGRLKNVSIICNLR